MADNVVLDAGAGGDTIRADDDGTAKWQYVKLAYGADNTQTIVTSTATNPLPVALSDTDNAVLDTIDAVLDTINAKLVTGTVIGDVNLGATDNAVLDSIDAAVNGTLTVAAHAVTNAGTFAVQISDTSFAVADGNALGEGVLIQGDDGTDRKNINVDATTGDVQVDVTNTVTVDGSGVTQPVSGTVTANLSATDNAVLDSIDAAVNGTLTVGSHAVTNAGTFAVQVDGAALTALQLIDDSIFADDAAFTLASSKVTVGGAIRDDTLGTLTAVEGDAVPLRVNSTGALHVTGGGGGTEYTLGTDTYTEATSIGAIAAVVRNDGGGSLVNTDNEVTALQVDSAGALRVTGGGGGTEYSEDVASPATIVGTATLMERDDALSTLTPIEGDWVALRSNARGALWVEHDTTTAIPVTDNGGTLTVDSGAAFTVQEDGAALTALQLIDDAVYADDADWTDGSSKHALVGGLYQSSPQTVTDGDVAPFNMTVNGALHTAVQNTVTVTATNLDVQSGGADLATAAGQLADGHGVTVDANVSTTGTTTFYDEDLDETKVAADAGPVNIYSIAAFNTTAAPLFLQLFNIASGSVTVGTTKPTNQYVIPGNADSDGAGFTLTFGVPKAYDTALTVACTTDSEGSGAPGAGACIVNIELAT